MRRVTPKLLSERSQQRNSDLPALKDILVNLSVKETPKVTKKLRMVGLPGEFYEVQNKKRIPGAKDTKQVPFPDADKNKRPTRIAHDDPSKCPWREMGYVTTRRFVQKCFEITKDEQGNEIWTPKLLVKGPSVFNPMFTWEEAQREDEEPVSFLGGDVAPVVKIVATADSSKLGGVDYVVQVTRQDVPLTEAHINQLRSIREPSVDDLNTLKQEYLKERAEDPTLPEWRDYFEYAFDYKKIFKYTPPMEYENTDTSDEETSPQTERSETLSSSKSDDEDTKSEDVSLEDIYFDF